MKLANIDIIFISYDEPNAELNYADLLNKAPWAKRVHGVKGSDAAHKAAAHLSETDWFITVDGDNQIYKKFLDLDLNLDQDKVKVFSWCGQKYYKWFKIWKWWIKSLEQKLCTKHENARRRRFSRISNRFLLGSRISKFSFCL
jgi:hypothetical protein